MTPDISLFCDPTEKRWNLATPWVQFGWRYACYAVAIVVRVPANGAVESPLAGERRPKALSLFKDFPVHSCVHPLSPIVFGDRPCLRCRASGCDANDQGDAIKGTVCPVCLGERWRAENQVIDGWEFSGTLLQRIATLPGLRISQKADGKTGLAVVAAGGLQGRIMPLASDKKTEDLLTL